MEMPNPTRGNTKGHRMTNKPDIHYHACSEDTEYRIRPNPDGKPGEGYKWGGWIEYKDMGEGEWRGDFFICPSVFGTLGLALIEAAKDTE